MLLLSSWGPQSHQLLAGTGVILFSLGNHGNHSESLSVLGLGFLTCALDEVMDMLAEVSLLFQHPCFECRFLCRTNVKVSSSTSEWAYRSWHSLVVLGCGDNLANNYIKEWWPVCFLSTASSFSLLSPWHRRVVKECSRPSMGMGTRTFSSGILRMFRIFV